MKRLNKAALWFLSAITILIVAIALFVGKGKSTDRDLVPSPIAGFPWLTSAQSLQPPAEIFSGAVLSAKDFSCPDCNVIIIGATNVQRNSMSLYGYQRTTTPNIDTFAKRAIVFENAYAPSSWTLPNFISIMTSQYPTQHQVMSRWEESGQSIAGLPISALPESAATMLEPLKQNGYRTGAFTGGFDFDPKYGVTSRFEKNVAVELKDLEGICVQSELAQYGSIRTSVPNALTWIDEHADEKFFAYIQGFDAHCPFALPVESKNFIGSLHSQKTFDRCYWTFDRAQETEVDGKKYFNLFTEAMPEDTERDSTYGNPFFSFSFEDLAYMKALYDGEILSVDSQLAILFQYLEKKKLLDKTIVIVLSEHGDMFGKHGRFMRGGPLRGTFYDDVLGVPLVLYHPYLQQENIRLKQLVELTDIAPTILDMLGLSAPPSFIGESLRKVLTLGDTSKQNIYAGATFMPQWSNSFFQDATYIAAMRFGDWKIIKETTFDPSFTGINTDSGASLSSMLGSTSFTKKTNVELYNLAEDPDEIVDRSISEPTILFDMRAALEQWSTLSTR